MTKKNKAPEKYQIWIDVRKRYCLSNVHIQMARELGMNPKKFGKIANEKQEPWKAPLPIFIERIYSKIPLEVECYGLKTSTRKAFEKRPGSLLTLHLLLTDGQLAAEQQHGPGTPAMGPCP